MSEITIIATKRVRKQIDNLPKDIKSKIDELLNALKISPIPIKTYDVKKIKGRESIYRVRIGDYRVVYKYEKKEKQIAILVVLVRGKAYKKM